MSGNVFHWEENKEVELGIPGWTTYKGIRGRKC